MVGACNVGLGSDNPAAQDVPRQSQVVFVQYDVTAGSEDATITGWEFERSGLGSADDFEAVYLVTPDGKIVSDDETVDDDDLVIIDGEWTIPAGQTATLNLIGVLNIDESDNTVRQNSFALVDVMGCDISGLPVQGNLMRTVDYEVAELTIDGQGSNSTISVGDDEATIGEFELDMTDNGTNDTDVKVYSIQLENIGTADLDEVVESAVLINRGDVVSTSYTIAGDYITFTLDGFNIEDGDNERFQVEASLV